MAHPPKIFRVFVSSTFSDMVNERNALQTKVFPRLQQLCLLKGARFQAIDLRWGISAEAGLNQRATDVCLNEIKRCQRVTKRPNFLLLMGDRYGWQPLPDVIPADEWYVLFSRAHSGEHDLLSQWYRPDTNAVPPVYLLQPRRGDTIEQTTWEGIESRLRDTLLNALTGLDWPREKLIKYETSVTEQEIEAGIFRYKHAPESAFCFFRTIDGLPSDAARFSDGNPAARERLNDLKKRLVQHLPNNIHSYEAAWTGNDIAIDLEFLCEMIYQVLHQAIEAEIATFEDVSPLDIEQKTHSAFMHERTRHFVGQVDSLSAIQRYLASSSHQPLILYGQSGVGKSSVIAQAIQQSGRHVLYRFIGATPDSWDIRTLLISLCHEITTRYGVTDTIPQDYEELIKAVPKLLANTTAQEPLHIFLDALDQLSTLNSPSNLRWLPNPLPPHVKFIVSAAPGSYLDALRQRLPEENFIEVLPMQLSDGEQLLEALLNHAGRTLQNDQRADVLNKFAQNGLPLYLKLAFEEAKLWPSYEPDFELQPDIPTLLRDNLFARLAHNAEHGEMLVSRSMAYIRASRNGLSEDELLDVLTQDTEFWTVFESTTHDAQREALNILKRLPIAVWSRLHFDLEPYLFERGADNSSLLAFYHRQFEAVVDTLYVAPKREVYHAHLARYFESQDTYTAYMGDWISNIRKLSELPYQQTQAGMADAVRATLTDLIFVTAKSAASGVGSLDEDYSAALALTTDAALNLFQRELRRLAQLLDYCDSPRDAGAVLHSRLRHVPVFEEGCQSLVEQLPRPFITSEYPLPDMSHPALIRTMKVNEVSLCALGSDGKRLLLAAPERESYNDDTWLTVWHGDSKLTNIVIVDAKTGAEQSSQILRGKILAVSPDIRFAVTLREIYDEADNKIHTGDPYVWDITSGEQLAVLNGHTGIVNASVFSQDGRWLVTASADMTLKVWDTHSWAEVNTLHGHDGGVSNCAISPDSLSIVSSQNASEASNKWAAEQDLATPIESLDIPEEVFNRFKIWNLHTGELQGEFGRGMGNNYVHGFHPNGRLVAVSRYDELIIHDLESGTERFRVQGMPYHTTSLMFSSDGQWLILNQSQAVSLSADTGQRTKIIDMKTGLEQTVLREHDANISACVYAADGKSFITTDEAGFVYWWDTALAVIPRAETDGHSYPISDAILSPNGQLLATASNQWGPSDDYIAIWETDSSRIIQQVDSHDGAMIFTSDSKTLITAGEGNSITRWDPYTGNRISAYGDYRNWHHNTQFSPDASWIVTGFSMFYSDEDFDPRSLRVYNASNGELKHILLFNDEFSLRFCFSHDGKWLAVCSQRDPLSLWDMETGTPIKTLESPHGSITKLVFSTDNQRLAAAMNDGIIKIWDTGNGMLLTTLDGESHTVLDCEFSPDGRWLISTSGSTLRLWDLYNGKCVTTFPGIWFNRCIVHHDGQRLIVIGGNHVYWLRIIS